MSCCHVFASAILALAWVVSSDAAAADHPSGTSRQRGLSVGDLFTIEALGAVVPAPDGDQLAAVISRPKKVGEIYESDGPSGYESRSDIWLVSTAGGRPERLTSGASDGSGYWNPVWSPDGLRLAFLSTHRRDGNAALYVWDGSSRKISKVTDRAISPPSVRWLDESTLVALAYPPGDHTPFLDGSDAAGRVAARGLELRRAGQQASVSVWQSPPDLSTQLRYGELLAIDTRKRQATVLARVPFVGPNFADRTLVLSPTRRSVAVIAQSTVILQPRRASVGTLPARAELSIVTLAGKSRSSAPRHVELVRSFDEVRGPEFEGEWSPDESTFAVIGNLPEQPRAQPAILLVSSRTSEIKVVDVTQFVPERLKWSASGTLLVYGAAVERTHSSGSSRFAWWSLADTRDPRNVTMRLTAPPSRLFQTADPNVLAGLSAGSLWRIDTEKAECEIVRGMDQGAIDSIIWASDDSGFLQGATNLLVRTRSHGERTFASVELTSREARVTALDLPASDAIPTEYFAKRGRVLYSNVRHPYGATRDGAQIWIAELSTRKASRLLKLNEHLTGIQEGTRVSIDYRGDDGNQLHGIALLPVNYEQGKRYPTVVWVYAGWTYTDLSAPFIDKVSDFYLNLQLLAAHGYVVLLPSIPLEPGMSDPFLEIPKAVLPAVNTTIDRGIADPKRIAVMGHSYGGYTVYSLLAHTDRFKAAVALAGLFDIISSYGHTDVRSRYDVSPLDYMSSTLSSSNAQGDPGKGSTPYANRWFWERNSPANYVDRIRTPVMIVQGDLDFVSIEQGEALFTALYRQGRQASFVRYWGEGHTIISPANIRDLWTRIYAWLDELLDVSRGRQGALLWDGVEVRARNSPSDDPSSGPAAAK